ncbi:conserved membrane hypothetical protein [Vibrio crassostreae]|nr:conserved membrane hypothetical protein [Vibrio crassostreae]CAK2326089.1 conserved membrane hypothetical protein [Vibrio crassostreae]CAK2480357.1 conserved membrane hypothetical protein [Vibrio crassostreae]CAK2883044.1 conserved membrane hypothetical protein [Vibrio crassostreae]
MCTVAYFRFVLCCQPLSRALYFQEEGLHKTWFSGRDPLFERRIKIEQQRQKIDRINNYFLSHPSILIALISGYVSICGFAILLIVFYKEGVNLIDYVSVGDFLFGVFAVEFAAPLIAMVLIILFWAYLRLSRVYWRNLKLFWTLVLSYLVVAPVFPAYIWYKPASLCQPDNRTYSVMYKHPNNQKETDLLLIASLSNYKVFKSHDPGCNVNFGEYTDDDFNKKFKLVVIHDSAIAKIESVSKKI